MAQMEGGSQSETWCGSLTGAWWHLQIKGRILPVLEGGVGLPGEHKQGFWGIPRQKDKTLAEQRHRMREGGGGKYWVWR